MQFRVPQFIDIEDKILGPLTWKQASYCLGAIGATYLGLRFVDSKLLGIIIASPFIGVFLALAFVKVNNQSFVEILEHAFNYYSRGNLYTWKKLQNKTDDVANVVQKQNIESVIPEQNNKRSLRDIAMDLDTKVDKVE